MTSQEVSVLTHCSYIMLGDGGGRGCQKIMKFADVIYERSLGAQGVKIVDHSVSVFLRLNRFTR